MSALGQLYATPVGNTALIGNWPDPEPLFTDSLKLANDSGDAALIALVQTRIAAWQHSEGQYELALTSYQQSYKAASSVSNANLQTQALIGVARAQSALKQSTEAVATLEQAAETARLLLPQTQASSNLAIIEVARDLPEGGNIRATALETNDGLKEQITDARLLASHYLSLIHI